MLLPPSNLVVTKHNHKQNKGRKCNRYGGGGRCIVCIAYCMLESSGAVAPSTNSKEAEF
uniref:Uncharacterized protein n=1 Tax=Anguilla anguilla TaxID=7936 RepID=A0A0E9UKI7_ANGAN